MKRGYVLVSVIWILAMLSLIVLGLGRRVMLDRRASAYSLDVSEATLLAHSAVQRGILELRNKAVIDAVTPEQMGGTHLGQQWAQKKSLVKDLKLLDWNEDREQDDVFFIITDEESKINLNNTPKEVLEEVPGLNRGIIRQILKRRTEAVHQDEGIAYFQVEEELRYLRDVKDKDWFGDEKNPGLKDLFTVHGDGKININTASESVLRCIPKLGTRAIRAILQYRAGPDGMIGTQDDKGFRSIEEVKEKTGISGDALDAIQQYCKFNSFCYRIRGIATLRGGKVRCSAMAIVYIEGNNANVVRWQENNVGL